jgi:hypothetical protein
VLAAATSNGSLRVSVAVAGTYTIRYRDRDGKDREQRVTIPANRVTMIRLASLSDLRGVRRTSDG